LGLLKKHEPINQPFMNQFAYYAEPPASFQGFGGSVVPSRIIYNGFGEPVGALPLIPLLTALAPLAAQVVGDLFKGASGTAGMDGFGYGDVEGLGLYAGPEIVPTQIVHNRFGGTVGAIPLVAALAPLAANAAGFIAPIAAKAASAIVPLVSKAAGAAIPAIQNIAARALPGLQQITRSLPQVVASTVPGIAQGAMPLPIPTAAPPPPPDMPPPTSSAAPMDPGPAAPTAPMPPSMAPGISPPPPSGMSPGPGMSPAPAMSPAVTMPPGYPGIRRRRRRRFIRRIRMSPRSASRAYPPPPMPSAPPPLSPAPVATEGSGGVHGFYGYGYSYGY
jgi:hypothetical protein